MNERKKEMIPTLLEILKKNSKQVTAKDLMRAINRAEKKISILEQTLSRKEQEE